MENKVIIVGGGISGLIACRDLARAGWNVTLLEAKARLGGRIHTMQEQGVPIELGAEFVHGENPALGKLIAETELSAINVPEKNRVFREGKLSEVPIWDKVGEIIHQIEPKKNDESFASLLTHLHLNASEEEMAFGFVQGFNAADPGRVGTHELLRAEVSSEHSAGSKQSRLQLGYGSLVQAIVKQIQSTSAKVRTGCEVRKIQWQKGKVECHFESDGRMEAAFANAAVITVPLGVLKSGKIRFEPGLHRKHEAIDQIHFGNVVKVSFLFRDYWWPGQDFGFIHSFGDLFPTWWSDSRGPLLTGWAGGLKADALTGFPDEQLKGIGMEILSRFFSRAVSDIKKELVSWHRHDWAEDPQVLGAYSYLPINGLDLPKLLAEPIEDTLFVAGEGTAMDGQMGTVFAAVESGLRVVKELGS